MSAPAFREFAEVALDLRKEQGVRGLNSERNRFKLHIVDAPFAQKPMDEIKPIELRDWLRAMQQKKARDTRGERLLSDPSIKRSWALVSSIFSCAVERDVIEVDPSTSVRMKKRSGEDATKDKWTYLTLEEQKLIVACSAIPFLDRLMIRFAIGTGLRQGEQCNLELKDLHVGADDPHVLVRYGGRGHLPPKNGKVRRVKLFGDALVAAKLWLYELSTFAPENPIGLVFPTPRGGVRPIGKPLGGGPKLRQHLALIGITRRVRWHDLRHTFCTNLVTGALGVVWPLIFVKEMAGHSSVMITERYAHVGQRDITTLADLCSFTHEGPSLAKAQPIDANDFSAVEWPEAVAS